MGRSTLELCKPLFPEYSIPYIFLDCNIFLIKYVNFLTQGQTLPHKRFVLYYIRVAGGARRVLLYPVPFCRNICEIGCFYHLLVIIFGKVFAPLLLDLTECFVVKCWCP